MKQLVRAGFLSAANAAYLLARPSVFRRSAQQTHHDMLQLLRRADGQPGLLALLDAVHRLAFERAPVTAGGVALDYPFILAAGLVKGDGFESEAAALAAVQRGANIMPGWASMPRLVGPVEFGSFTRRPRVGNPGTVTWRDVPARSTQNRVGLRNPGAHAAAAFLAMRKRDLPAQFGINVAVSPGVDDPGRPAQEVREALAAFVERGICPAWFTLNLSCPNTEDDPNGNQAAAEARQICGAAVDAVRPAPLWVKLGPALAEEQYRALMAVFAEVGVRAVVATNTLPAPTPDDSGQTAGVGGGRLHMHAVEAVRRLHRVQAEHGYPVDIIACGGIQDGATYNDFARLGVRAVQYWSGLVYRGPLAAALIAREAG
ncbi:MAG: hypothetical protein JXB47_19575 [Anaerolineae bacterium]|nr:hypothetical protein [Anaerolineae bacterium]